MDHRHVYIIVYGMVRTYSVCGCCSALLLLRYVLLLCIKEHLCMLVYSVTDSSAGVVITGAVDITSSHLR